jgi:hypothetical protein
MSKIPVPPPLVKNGLEDQLALPKEAKEYEKWKFVAGHCTNRFQKCHKTNKSKLGHEEVVQFDSVRRVVVVVESGHRWPRLAPVCFLLCSLIHLYLSLLLSYLHFHSCQIFPPFL